MLDHADAGDGVERGVAQLAVVGHPDLHAVLEAALAHPLLGDRRLRLGERYAGHLDVVALGRVDREAAPAAAHVEQAVAGLQVELAADEVELLLLGLLERPGAAREERAAVGERLAEEEREELGRQVVVVAHGAGVAPDAVALAARAQLRGGHGGRAHRAARTRGRQGQARALGALHGRRLPGVEQVERGLDVVGLERAGHVGAAQAELAGGAQHVRHGVARARTEDDPGPAGGRQAGAVPELELERPVGKGRLELLQQRGGGGHGAPSRRPSGPAARG